jgi:hypothetical protein
MKQKAEAGYEAGKCFTALDINQNGRSGDKIPEGKRFSVRVQTGNGAHPVPNYFTGDKTAGAWR